MDFNRWVSAYKQIADLENRPDVSDYIQKTYWNAEKGIYDLPDERKENKKGMKVTKLSENESLLTKLESLEEELKSIKRELTEHLVDKDELVQGRHIKFADRRNGYKLEDAYILWHEEKYRPTEYEVVYTEEELKNLDGRNSIIVRLKDIVQTLELVDMPKSEDIPDEDADRDGEPEMDYRVTGDALDKMKANRFSDPEYFDKDDAGEFFVTGYVANYGHSPAEGGVYYIEGWYPVCSKAFATIDEARKYLYDCKKAYQKDGFKVYDYTQDSFRCEEDSKYVAHEEYKYFVEPKAKRYSRTEKGHGWDW